MKIKYRALGTKGWKPTENKGWYYGTEDYLEYSDKSKPQVFNLYFFEKNIKGNYFDKNTRCIFTGLYDCEGVEIYEGDILLFPNQKRPSGIDKYFQDQKLEVVYTNGSFVGTNIKYNEQAKYYNSKRLTDITYFLEMNIRIIGNIYENEKV